MPRIYIKGGRPYIRVASNETIQHGAQHSHLGGILIATIGVDVVGQTPADFDKSRIFYNEVLLPPRLQDAVANGKLSMEEAARQSLMEPLAEMVSVEAKALTELQVAADMLAALVAAGVKDWHGYNDAQALMVASRLNMNYNIVVGLICIVIFGLGFGCGIAYTNIDAEQPVDEVKTKAAYKHAAAVRRNVIATMHLQQLLILTPGDVNEDVQ